ncbi:helicase associated domain-containing protein [Streptomyces sp. NBC_01363]|uniref:helicase associated domain-containing protein n=1 Tax=Streptomyces sp. NBC_01363 TaxID=2903840 RepID=UPI002B1DF1DA|nr:helicase associated domain-containing protein [Streptomyces sp. NBC_01363]
MVWSEQEAAWADRVAVAREYAAVHGHFLPPTTAVREGHPIGVWAKNARAAARRARENEADGSPPPAPCPMRPGLHRRRPWRCRRQRERRRQRTVDDESAQTGQPQRSATLPAPPGRRSAHDPLQHDSNQFGLRFASRFRQIRRRGLPVPQLGGPYVAVDH